MESIQIALSDAAKSDTLRVLLARSTHVPVYCVECPDCVEACVVVMDSERFECLSRPLINADRIVLITRSEPQNLKKAWEAGVNSVLSEQDSLNTVVLAVLATCLRSGTARQKQEPGGQTRL
ncbi:MAG: hypothetical protein HY821_20265 [Acidobacteria bacterium]|nr:hypothetical protein [Acidobacteriota bacterium]